MSLIEKTWSNYACFFYVSRWGDSIRWSASNVTSSWLGPSRAWLRSVWKEHWAKIHRGSRDSYCALWRVQLLLVNSCIYRNICDTKLINVWRAAIFLFWGLIFCFLQSFLKLCFMLMHQSFKNSQLLDNLLLKSDISHSEVGQAEDWFQNACFHSRTLQISISEHITLGLLRHCVSENGLA